ncbi:MAG: helix-turn-helix transcriptional regulator [Candidatus Eisenbacteria bacterium]|nr:helix-turn-helix transcriptional regulator [Candidatus Eisenbacteria bacterium]
MNLKLKLALLENGGPQYVIARKMGVSETRLSRIIRGRIEPTPAETARLSELLGVAGEDIAGASIIGPEALPASGSFPFR